ncbi:hypothetical protein [Cohnella nanjingensis]|uniref:hypothetical protein n=1 Tax=Cohnella nanjingensis TaxID=1387779 RepID=UPI001FEC25E1
MKDLNEARLAKLKEMLLREKSELERHFAQASDARRTADGPVEERVMTPPPSGAGADRRRQAGRFDDAGAWEAVEEYGNSSDAVSPSEPESEAAAAREVNE